MKISRLPILILLASSLAIAADQASLAPGRSLVRFANEMTLVALREGSGVVSTEALREHATALMKFLEGEPTSSERLVVHIENDPDKMNEDELSIYVGYDNSFGSRGYLFTYRKKMGILKSITVVPGK